MTKFGDDFEIHYDCIVNHDIYSHMRVTVEVPRDQNSMAIILLNGREIGTVTCHRKGPRSQKVSHYTATRYKKPNVPIAQVPVKGEFKEMGKAAAAIISDYILM